MLDGTGGLNCLLQAELCLAFLLPCWCKAQEDGGHTRHTGVGYPFPVPVEGSPPLGMGLKATRHLLPGCLGRPCGGVRTEGMSRAREGECVCS